MNMFVKTIFIVLLTSTTCFAETWVCFNASSKYVEKRLDGDGFILGVCGLNNSNIIPTCILATPTEYAKASDRFTKYDASVVSGSRIVDMTVSEKSAITTAEAAAALTAKRTDAKNQYSLPYLKAIVQAIVDEFNRNRTWDNKPQITKEDVLNAIYNKVDSGSAD